jgi:putative flippase GtrA
MKGNTMKTFLKFALFPVVLFVAVYLIPTGIATLINAHNDVASLTLIFFVSLGFGWIATYLYNKFIMTKETTNEDT